MNWINLAQDSSELFWTRKLNLMFYTKMEISTRAFQEGVFFKLTYNSLFRLCQWVSIGSLLHFRTGRQTWQWVHSRRVLAFDPRNKLLIVSSKEVMTYVVMHNATSPSEFCLEFRTTLDFAIHVHVSHKRSDYVMIFTFA